MRLPIVFLFLGDGAMKAELKTKAAHMGLGNVMFLDTVSKSDVPRFWSLVDISIIHLKRDPLFANVFAYDRKAAQAPGPVAGPCARRRWDGRDVTRWRRAKTCQLAE